MIKILYVSGYKSTELGLFRKDDPNIAFIKIAIRKSLLDLLEEGLEWVITSGQLGVELWTAEVVLELRDQGKQNIKLAILTPFLNQEGNWSDANKEHYHAIMEKADFVDSISKKPYESPAQFRAKNQFAIQKSDALLLVYDTEKEASPKYLLQMAENYRDRYPYEIRLISFYDLQLIIEEEQRNRYENDYY